MVIFDWDGTLCDSVEHIVHAMQGAARELGETAPEAPAIRDIVGLGLPQAVSILFPQVTGSAHDELARAYSRHYIAGEDNPPELFAGAMDTLEELRARGLQLAIATGKSRRGLERILSSLGLEDFFDNTRCADETSSKPDPKMLLELMADADKLPEQVVMVGDTEYDLAMASNAGVASVGVTFGVHTPERLATHAPVALIDSLPELLTLEVFKS